MQTPPKVHLLLAVGSLVWLDTWDGEQQLLWRQRLCLDVKENENQLMQYRMAKQRCGLQYCPHLDMLRSANTHNGNPSYVVIICHCSEAQERSTQVQRFK